MRRITKAGWLPPLLAAVVVLGGWQLVGLTIFRDTHTIPTVTSILSEMKNVGSEFWWNNISTTLREAATGWAWGNAFAIVTALAFVQVPFLEKALMQLAVASYCLPILVLGVVLNIQFTGDAPKVILAAISVYFTTLIGCLLGLKSADRTSLDLVRAYGGGSWTQLRKVRIRACLPSLFSGLRIAAPAAVLGAILGEWMGSESGLGTAMIAAQSGLQIERTWAIAVAATAVSGAAYAATALIGNLLTTWAPKVQR
ncbi:MAG: putative transporter, permease protein [Acidimicrobiales bacterium]|nr:putative transporter, permease protein [Acidimicrobiales bacterium]